MSPSLSIPIFVWTTFLVSSIHAFSTPTPRPFIEFTNPLKQAGGGTGDKLPASFVSNWPTWILDLKNGRWQKIPDSDGFVPPTSVEELWQPRDLQPPDCQLAVGLHVRDGMIRHLLPAVDLSLQGHHRNRGLCSVPRAYQWMDFGSVLAGGLDVVTMALQIRDNENNEEEEGEWETLAEMDSVQETIEAAIEALADDPPAELGDGSAVVHILCDNESVVCPRPGSEMRVVLEEDGFTVGVLQVSVVKTSPGSKSEYLPEAYKPLFEDETLIRPAFIKAKKRMEARAKKQAEK